MEVRHKSAMAASCQARRQTHVNELHMLACLALSGPAGAGASRRSERTQGGRAC
jgi:hypothetical protein